MRYSMAARCFDLLARLMLMGLLSVSAGIGWASPVQGSHCESHASVASIPSAHAQHDAEPPAIQSRTHGAEHDCPHCPHPECSRFAPCTASGSVAAEEACTPITD